MSSVVQYIEGSTMKLSQTELDTQTLAQETLAEAVREIEVNGYVLFEGVLPPDFVQELHAAFMNVFNAHIAKTDTNRGSNRYQMHLPFTTPFNDPRIIANPFVLPLVDAIIGKDAVCNYFASDTPLPGSDYQQVHSDMTPLFPETDMIVPPYALVLNIPLVDFREDNGPLEIWPGGSHLRTPPREQMQKLAPLMAHHSVLMPAGSLLIRDGRMWHRGTPNRSDAARPNMALIYAYHWFGIGYPRIGIPQDTYDSLSERAKHLFRKEDIGGVLAHS
jgi:hypothetical protein